MIELQRRDIAIARRNHQPITIILCDIDYFKQYNDYYGHVKGDKALQQVAKTIQQELKREVDFVARYGGEEFIIVLSGTDKNTSLDIAEHMRATIQQLTIKHEARLDKKSI